MNTYSSSTTSSLSSAYSSPRSTNLILLALIVARAPWAVIAILQAGVSVAVAGVSGGVRAGTVCATAYRRTSSQCARCVAEPSKVQHVLLNSLTPSKLLPINSFDL
jgi:hypothetical protein